ncbi:hypothetical protein [Methylotenera sp.]|uniref:PilN domain-containing protein n=1 Tax=Methylotenera sp. TaxID=2051956 RepID=UPI002489A11D|nr:hypothetical protein [Methylotenera sp.]MDI1299758.1 hypothetical protein [Methylotenera sp.]
MLLPWSKQSTLAISNHGIAFKHADGQSQLLTDSQFTLANVAPLNTDQLAEILIAHQSSLKHQQMQVRLSNTLIRYLVLPWQNEVFAKNDWQSIAQHEFRKQYGAAADAWKVSVSFGNYGQTIIAAAMDESLFAQLEASAKTLSFTITSIQPLLMTLLNTTAEPQRDWTLIAEPERIMLCRAYKSEWQQIAIDSPPTGLEYQHAEQLINRNLLQVATNEQPSKVNNYVSAALHKVWKHTDNKLQKTVLRSNSTQAHALWMAELPLNKKSPNINLDFAENTQLNNTAWTWGLLAIALLAMTLLYAQYQVTSKKINQQIELSENKTQSEVAAKHHLDASPAMQDKLKLAQLTQQQLDLPWMQMLKALETVKTANPHIAILSISPNKNRAEIKLTGQTSDFSDLTNFLDALRTNSSFNDAVLVSQHLEDDQAKLLYVFEVNLGWRV